MSRETDSDAILGAERSADTDRGIGWYKSDLDFTDDDLLRWGLVVDLGSGTRQTFAREVRERHGDKVTVISADPRLPSRRFPRATERTLAAIGERLPFKSNSVGAVLSEYAVPVWSATPDHAIAAIREIVRVLRVGGESRLCPIPQDVLPQITEELLRMRDEGVIRFEFSPEDVKVRPKLLSIEKLKLSED